MIGSLGVAHVEEMKKKERVNLVQAIVMIGEAGICSC